MSTPVSTSTVTPALIQQARAVSMSQGQTVLAALHGLSGLNTQAVTEQLAEMLSFNALSMLQLQALIPNFDAISYTDCAQRGVVVANDHQGQSFVVLSDPFDMVTESYALRCAAQQGITGAQLTLCHPDDLLAWFLQLEQKLRAMDGFESDQEVAMDEEVAAVITLASINDDSSSVVKLVNSTLYDALKLKASDIHLECDAGCLHVQYRIDGVLVAITQIQGQEMAEQVISRVKVMAELDIAERRVPQDGRFKVRVNGRDIDFRVSVMPNIFGEDAVLRLLDRQSLTEEAKSLRLDNLGLDLKTMTLVRRLSGKPHGMLLVTGPTGSGKTTTLYAAITEINTGRDKIVTIEDPVEYRLPRVLQIPVNEKKGLTFARGLRSILRHDPDKIMVGEIRDNETAQIAVQAALTGHLVFTTVHANNVFDVLGRFLHMGVDAYSFAAALNGIVAQRLLRLNCTSCAIDEAPTEQDMQDANLQAEQVAGWQFKMGKGCGTCRGTGYKGRQAVAEVLILDDSLREMIASRVPISQLKEYAAKIGMLPLQKTALQLVADGRTTLAEVYRVAG
jgi:general secretion pathway protein E